MATLRIDIEQSGGQSVQRQINNLRETTNQLNRTILQNREASLGADRAEQRHLRTLNQSNAVQKAQIQQRIQELNLQKQNIALAEREARAREGQARGASILTRSLGALGTQVGALGFAVAAREVGQFVASSARAAIQVESYTNAFASLGLGAQGAAQRIDQLQELSRLPGISFDQAVAGAVRLRTVGIEGERADAVLREMGNALALVGSTDLSGALLGLTQIASRGRVSAEEINQLTERSGIFAAALQDAFGSISSENIQMQLDQTGESAQDFVDRFVGALQGQARVSLDSTANAIQNLQNSFFLLQAEIGQRLTPVIASSARGLGDFLDRVRDFISGADDGTEATASFRQALQEADTALERRDAIDARIDYLETFKQGLFDAANELDRFDSRLAGIQGQIDETNERIQTLTDIREGRITTADLERDLEGLIDTYSELAAEETRREEQVQLTHLAVSEVARARLVQIRDEKDELADQIEEYQNYISVSREVGEAAEQAATRATEGNQRAADATENLNTQLVRIGDQVTRLSDAFNEVSGTDDIQAIEAAASNLTSALERELALQLMDAELTAADRLDLELSTARAIEGVNRDAQQRISQISQDRSDDEVAAAERQRDARIESAERTRAAEVAANEAAAASGAAYALQLAEIGNVAQRRAFVAIVERLQDQGLSLDEARERAAQFIPILATLATGVNTADHAFGNFTSTLVRDADLSADAVANLTRNVMALGTAISRANANQSDRAFIGFGRDITGRATGTTIESDQAAAGQQGRAFVNRLRERQAREASQRLQRGLSEIQNYAVAVSDVLGSIDNDYADLTSRMAENTASFVRFASGDFTALADVALNVIDFIQDREAHLHEVRMRQAAERLAFETEAAERIRSANTIANALGVDPNQFLTPGQARFSPGQRGGELGELGLIAPLTTLPTLDLQAIVDSAPDISTGLTGALEQQLTSAIAVAFANGEPVIEAFQPFFAHLETAMDRAGAAFDTALQGAADPSVIQYRFETLVSETTEFYDLQIRAVQAAATQSGNTARQATFELIQERDNIINEATNALRNASSGTGRFAAFQRAQNYQQRIATNRTPADIDAEYLATFTPGDPIADLPIRGGIEDTPELTPAESIAPIIEGINEAVELINASIVSVSTQIDQSNDPAEIAMLLSQVPALIAEKYAMLRQALNERYNAGLISVDVYNASLSELGSDESRALEQHSDQVLSNVVRGINEDIGLIDASITDLETQISGLSDPEAIAELLGQIPGLITEKYQLLRDALDARYVAGEISVDVYNSSLSILNSREAGEIESNSDAVLANTLQMIDDDVDLIDAEIGALQFAVENTDDPEAVAGLLDAIKILIMDKYRRLRERLDALLAEEEISQTAYDAATLAFDTAEGRALGAIDTQALNAISDAAQEQVSFINGAIENLRLSLELTDNPAEAQQILDAIRVLVGQRFDVLIAELKDLEGTLDDDEFDQALEGLELGKTLALENIDTEKFSVITEAAQMQVDFINGGIENIRVALQLTDDPTEQQNLIDAIRILTAARFRILREELEAIRDTLKPEEFDQALMGLNLGEQLALDNLDTEQFNLISEAAQKQVDFINGAIENLRLSFELTDDPEQQQGILDSIRILTQGRFRILRAELEKIKNSFGSEAEYNQALQGINLAEQVALENIDTEKFNLISEAAQEQIATINTDIEQLRLSLELTDDPEARQGIIAAIRALTINRFAVLREELEKIKDSFGSEEEYDRAVAGVDLAEQVALKNLDTEKFAEISAAAQKQVTNINTDIEHLRISFELSDDPEARQGILSAIRALVKNRFRILREELEDIEETFESDADYQRALNGLNLGEQLALDNLDQEQFDLISEAAQKQVNLISGNINNLRTALELTDDPELQQGILAAIKALTVARFKVLREELIKIKGSFDSDAEFNTALAGLNLAEDLALDNLTGEQFSLLTEAAQMQVDFVQGAINNLELSLQLTDDPAEIARILNSIRILTAKRFEILIAGLKAIEDSFDDPAVFAQTLEGLELGRDVAFRGIDDRIAGVGVGVITGQINETDAEIAALFADLENATTASGVAESIGRLKRAIENKYRLIREGIEASADSEESQAEQIAAVNQQEQGELQALGQRGLGAFSSLIDTAQFLLDNATEADFGTRRQNLITAINTFYDERIAFINGLDLSDTDRMNMLEVVRISRTIALDAIPEMHESVTERLEMERELQAEIKDLRDDAFDNEERRQQRLVDLEQETQNRILDIQRNANRSREDIERDFQDAYQDIQRQRVFGEITDEEASSRLQELGRERLRDLRDIDIRTGRRREDVGIRQERSEAEIEASAMATANAIREVLTPLLTGQEMSPSEMAMEAAMTPPAEASAMAAENTGTTAENTTEISEKLDPVTEIRDYNLEMLQVLGLSLATQTRSAFNLEALLNVTFHGEAARQRLIDEVEALGGMLPDTTQIGLATTETTAAAIQSGIATLEESLGRDIDVMAGAPVESRMMMAGEPVTPQMMQAMNVSISAQNVVIQGENMSGEVNARITNPEDVSPDITVELTDD